MESEPRLPAPLQAAIDAYDSFAADLAREETVRNTVKTALYHYTDANGLRGILASGKLWFTDYKSLNDPSEVLHGIKIAANFAKFMADQTDVLVKFFLDSISDFLMGDNFDLAFHYFVASLSKKRDSLPLWQSYANNGRGFSIGFAPPNFAIVDQKPGNRPADFVGHVIYDKKSVEVNMGVAIRRGAEIFFDALQSNNNISGDKNVVIRFMRTLALRVIASPLIWQCMTTKHPAYSHEDEIRWAILGSNGQLDLHISTRLRGSAIVPYIAHPVQVREPGMISEIIIGPAAPPDTERNLKTMIRSLGIGHEIPIAKSGIPYRPV